MMLRVAGLTLLAGCVTLAGATHAIANSGPNFVQVVALDECDPDTFNAALGEGGTGFCHNVAADSSRTSTMARSTHETVA
jgi:hypothetical protein